MKSYNQDFGVQHNPQAISDSVFSYTLTANTVQNISVPTGALYAVFTSNGNYVVKNTANVSLSFAHDGTDGVINLPSCKVDSTTFSIISDSTPTVSVSFYGK